ncbi:hypothetical protein ACWFQ8_09635 [Streptomyces sp. NPDC055254]
MTLGRIRSIPRGPRRLGLAGVVLAAVALAPGVPAYALPLTLAHARLTFAHAPFTLAHALPPTLSAVAAGPAAADDDPSDAGPGRLAGSAYGVGRERPGRPADAAVNPEAVAAPRPPALRPRTQPVAPPRPEATPPPAVSALGTGPNERAADLAAHILPLGTGFALMGVGLGYLGMRLRKGI